jgi:hypothetical protein
MAFWQGTVVVGRIVPVGARFAAQPEVVVVVVVVQLNIAIDDVWIANMAPIAINEFGNLLTNKLFIFNPIVMGYFGIDFSTTQGA